MIEDPILTDKKYYHFQNDQYYEKDFLLFSGSMHDTVFDFLKLSN